MIGVERGLPVRLRGRQALDRALQCLEVLIKSTPDSLFKWSCTSIVRVIPSPEKQVQCPHITTV